MDREYDELIVRAFVRNVIENSFLMSFPHNLVTLVAEWIGKELLYLLDVSNGEHYRIFVDAIVEGMTKIGSFKLP